VWTDGDLPMRPLRAFHTLSVYGLGAGSTHPHRWGLVVGAGWLAVVAMGAALRPWRTPVSRIVALWAMPHLSYVFLAHDMEFPRYMLSAVTLISLVGGLAPARFGRAGLAAVLVTVAATAAVSGPLAVRQRRQPPVELRIAEFLATRPRPALVIVEHPGLGFFLDGTGVVSVDADAAEIPQWRARWASAGHEVYATAPPPQDPSGWRPVAHFCRDPLINPYLSHEIWLFAPVSASLGEGGPVIDCGE
jgi:hypothetical protein